MIGDASSSKINIPGTGLSVEVVGRKWTIRATAADHRLARGTASGPQAAANAARNRLLQWGGIVRAM
jgi:hypothetical protein